MSMINFDFDAIIKEANENEYAISFPIEDFTIEQLAEFAEKVWKKGIEIKIEANHSNFYQGTLVNIKKMR